MTFSDVAQQGLILPKKKLYTVRDFKRLVEKGVLPKEARFICMCSAIYHSTNYSKSFNSVSMRIACGIA